MGRTTDRTCSAFCRNWRRRRRWGWAVGAGWGFTRGKGWCTTTTTVRGYMLVFCGVGVMGFGPGDGQGRQAGTTTPHTQSSPPTHTHTHPSIPPITRPTINQTITHTILHTGWEVPPEEWLRQEHDRPVGPPPTSRRALARLPEVVLTEADLAVDTNHECACKIGAGNRGDIERIHSLSLSLITRLHAHTAHISIQHHRQARCAWRRTRWGTRR